MQKIFHDFEGIIRLKNDDVELILDKKQFQEFEKDYKLPGGFTSRYYDGKAHWISNGEVQQLATDFSYQDVEKFLIRIEDYQIRLDALTPSPEALGIVEEIAQVETPQLDKWESLKSVLSWNDLDSVELNEALDQKDEGKLYQFISQLKLDKRNCLYVKAALQGNGFQSDFLTIPE